VDIGCGIPSLIPIDAISVSRISHPADRFLPGQDIEVIVKGRDSGKILLSHKELLGTWEENAELFSVGETVTGIVRSIETYGIFIELAPNLVGLAEPQPNVLPNQRVSVYIKALLPEKMKVKLVIVELFDQLTEPLPFHYFHSSNHISNWVYSSPSSLKMVESIFSAKAENILN
jgi:small subunit ribosomal protein S1